MYQDDDLVAVSKPSGMVVHRGWANDKQVAMTEVRDQIGKWVYPAHRLDLLALAPLLLVPGEFGDATSGAETIRIIDRRALDRLQVSA